MNTPFTIAMNQIFNVVDNKSIQETIAAYAFDFDAWNNEDENVPCKQSETGLFYILYDLCNYDLICVNNGKVDLENSNHLDIAKLIAPFASTHNCQLIEHNLYNYDR